jgi:hypothetical protein
MVLRPGGEQQRRSVAVFVGEMDRQLVAGFDLFRPARKAVWSPGRGPGKRRPIPEALWNDKPEAASRLRGRTVIPCWKRSRGLRFLPLA